MFDKNGAEMDQGAPPEKRARLSEQEYEALKARLKARKKIFKTYPLFKLMMAGVPASLASPKDTRAPLTIKDVQDLILCAVNGEVRHLNRWFLLRQVQHISQTTVLVVENVSLSDLEDNEEGFSKTLEIFEDVVEMINPKSDGINLSVALAYSPMSNDVEGKMRKVYKSPKEALDDGHVFRAMDCTEQSNQEIWKFGRKGVRSKENLDLQDALLMKFFTFIQSVEKSALLITHPAYEKIYRPKTPLHPRLFGCAGAPVKIVQQPEMEKIATMLESEPNTNLVFVHTAVAKEEENKGHLKKLDQLIVDLHDRMPMRGVMIIIFGGKDKSLENGLCMVNVKKPPRDEL